MHSLSELIQAMVSPIVSFLKERGVWHTLVMLWDQVVVFINSIASWLDATIDVKELLGIIVFVFTLIFKVIVFVVGFFISLIDKVI